MQPAAVNASVADWDAAAGLHFEGAGELRVAAEQPQAPAAATLLHHAAQVGVERLQSLTLADALAIGRVAHQDPRPWRRHEVAAVAQAQFQGTCDAGSLSVAVGLIKHAGILLPANDGRQGFSAGERLSGQVAGRLPLLLPELGVELWPALQGEVATQTRRPAQGHAGRLN